MLSPIKKAPLIKFIGVCYFTKLHNWISIGILTDSCLRRNDANVLFHNHNFSGLHHFTICKETNKVNTRIKI